MPLSFCRLAKDGEKTISYRRGNEDGFVNVRHRAEEASVERDLV